MLNCVCGVVVKSPCRLIVASRAALYAPPPSSVEAATDRSRVEVIDPLVFVTAPDIATFTSPVAFATLPTCPPELSSVAP
ncbi:filamentous hemagglutinin domain protein [Burkholderia pseudomallei MSHR7343]|nr:filamentous hemagglutinin domain protein [Burkholderia pseudomallei MSHR7343]